MSSSARPYSCSFAGPIPEIASSASSDAGRRSAIRSRVASLKMT
jgi:hypothetical protein